MAEKKSFKFDEWWESPKTKRVVGAIYSLGASVVIIGAMFKILHLPGAGITLGIGMVTEAFLFAIGVFDKPHTEYHWQNIFPALLEKEAQPLNISGGVITGGASGSTGGASGCNGGVSGGVVPSGIPGLSNDEMQRLTDGIKNLSETATQLASLSSVVGSTEKLASTLDAASEAASSFVESQSTLNVATKGLEASYQSITSDMDSVVKQTKNYGEKMESINSHLASINSVYELQLRNIQAQSESFGEQSEKVGLISNHLANICGEVGKIQSAVTVAADESEKYKAGAVKLSQQVAELNKVYGNMLNALG